MVKWEKIFAGKEGSGEGSRGGFKGKKGQEGMGGWIGREKKGVDRVRGGVVRERGGG